MRTTFQWMLVTGEVLLFGLGLTALAHSAEFPPLKPTYVAANASAVNSPFTSAQPVRVTMTNRDGQTTTLEYRKPVQVVSYESELHDDGLVPVSSLPVLSSPAREEDLVDITNVREVRYVQQTPLNTIQTIGNPQRTSLPVMNSANIVPVGSYVPVGSMPAGTVVNYAPTTTYSVPNYNVPITGGVQTVYQPITSVPMTAAANPEVQVGKGVYGQPVIYRPGQPVRNAMRYLTP